LHGAPPPVRPSQSLRQPSLSPPSLESLFQLTLRLLQTVRYGNIIHLAHFRHRSPWGRDADCQGLRRGRWGQGILSLFLRAKRRSFSPCVRASPKPHKLTTLGFESCFAVFHGFISKPIVCFAFTPGMLNRQTIYHEVREIARKINISRIFVASGPRATKGLLINISCITFCC